MTSLSDISMTSRRWNGLLRDLAAGMKQQMYFWGRDVIHPSGNLLIRQGFVKSPSAGLQGTSCYSCEFRQGRIELHGACAGWYPDAVNEPGFLYVRPKGQCLIWRGDGPPVPGEWPENLLKPIVGEIPIGCRNFIEWWLQSELWITETQGANYRMECFRVHKRLPKSKPWLAPQAATAWLEEFLTDPAGLKRAKQFVNVAPHLRK